MGAASDWNEHHSPGCVFHSNSILFTDAESSATVDPDPAASGGDAATAPGATTPPPPEVGAQTPAAAAARATSG